MPDLLLAKRPGADQSGIGAKAVQRITGRNISEMYSLTAPLAVRQRQIEELRIRRAAAFH